MSQLGAVAAWRLREKVYFGNNEDVELDNGNTVDKFVEKFHRNCANYRISPRFILSNPGINFESTITLAIRHFNDTDYTSYTAMYKGEQYQVTHWLPDDTKIVTYDLLFLKKVEKNG